MTYGGASRLAGPWRAGRRSRVTGDVVPTERAHPRRRRATTDAQVVNLTIAPDKLLLTVVETAHKLGISGCLLSDLIAAGEIETIHIGRLCKITARRVDAFVERRDTPTEPE